MVQTIVAPEVLQPVRQSSKTMLAGVLLMSLASLLLELSLTRLFSVILFYHFAFLAISIALLGLGAGGVFAYVFKPRLAHWTLPQLGGALGIASSLLMVAVLEIDLHIPVELHLTSGNLFRLTVIYLISSLPFFCTGLFFSALFARDTENISQLYAADLFGGAAACLAIVPLLNFLGGPNTILVAGLCFAGSGLIWADTKRTRTIAGVLGGALLLLIAANYSGRLIDIIYAKGIRRDKPWVEYSRWNAISRIEVDNQGGAKVVVIDADASTYIMALDPKLPFEGSDYQKNLMSAAPSIANILRPHGEYAIIGPGGGVDVLRAVSNGSPSVTGIEINPIIATRIMRDRYADYSYHLYQRPDVHIQVSDGRSWVRNANQQFDVLQMTLVDTWASTAAGAFALSENNLYTVEAFREYFAHLRPDGFIAITRWEFRNPREALRVVSQAMRALGGGNLRDHFIIVSDGALDVDGRPVTVLAKKTPFTQEEELAVSSHLARYPNLIPLYMPSLATTAGPEPQGAKPFRDLIWSQNPEKFAAGYIYNVEPVYDNAPFFFFTLKPSQLLGFGSTSAIDWKVNMGVLVLLMLLLISVLAVLLFLILPLLAVKAPSGSPRWLPLLYFVAIGLGYIALEITMIQRLVLFLGHPIYAMTVVVFLMLLSSGAGSFASRHWLERPSQVWKALLLVVAMLSVYLLGLSALLHHFVGSPFAVKLVLSALMLIPLGFAMGMPFPSGLRLLCESRSDDNLVEWAWAINAASSVLGSVLAMTVAIQFGLLVTLEGAALAYVLALLLLPRLRRA
jgi:spermidine synthase